MIGEIKKREFAFEEANFSKPNASKSRLVGYEDE